MDFVFAQLGTDLFVAQVVSELSQTVLEVGGSETPGTGVQTFREKDCHNALRNFSKNPEGPPLMRLFLRRGPLVAGRGTKSYIEQ